MMPSMSASPWRLQITKEIRALAPAWLAIVGTMIAASLSLPSMFREVGALAYVFGAVALGALSIGQEFSGGTLTVLLCQPVRRSHLFWSKLAVLVPMEVILAALAAYVCNRGVLAGGFTAATWQAAANRSMLMVLIVPVLSGTFITPWLTILSRGALAGGIFTAGVQVALLAASDLVGNRLFDSAAARSFDDFQFAVQCGGTFVFSVLGVVFGLRAFVHLQEIEKRSVTVNGRPWRPSRATIDAHPATFRRRNPILLLVRKELRLQQLSFVAAGLFIVISVARVLARRIAPAYLALALPETIILYIGFLALLIGSLASAEERQMGTMGWQALMPVSMHVQWAVKVATVLGLSALLAIAVPELLWYFDERSAADFARSGLVLPNLPVLVLFSVISLWASSLCSSGLRAVLVSLGVAVGGFAVGAAQAHVLRGWLMTPAVWLSFTVAPHGIMPGSAAWLDGAAASFAFALPAVVLLRLAYLNHRSAESGTRRIWRQALWIAGCAVLVSMVYSEVSMFVSAGRRYPSRPPASSVKHDARMK